MAPQYAPSLRSCLAPLLLLLQIGFIVFYAFCIEINSYPKKDNSIKLYPEFQDVNTMVILGFGFLCTFLVRYGFSGSGFNLLVAVIAIQWSIVLSGIESLYYRGTISIDLESLGIAEMCAASALIAMRAMLGKTNPVQLIIIALLEVFGYCLNRWLQGQLMQVQPLNSIMMLHIFGAFFGLMLTWILHRSEAKHPFEKEKYDRKTALFSMLGSVFLWMFWPSFNSAFVSGEGRKKLWAICSTYLALAVSAVTAPALSVLCSPKGKLHLIHMQSCILAGGIAVGVCISDIHQPWEAMMIGFSAAVISLIGFRYLKTHMLVAFQCHDTLAVFSTHGLSALLGWIARFFLKLQHCHTHTEAIRFAVFHICSLLLCIALSLTMGIITGFILQWNFWRPPQDKKCFDDQAFWEFPHLGERK